MDTQTKLFTILNALREHAKKHPATFGEARALAKARGPDIVGDFCKAIRQGMVNFSDEEIIDIAIIIHKKLTDLRWDERRPSMRNPNLDLAGRMALLVQHMLSEIGGRYNFVRDLTIEEEGAARLALRTAPYIDYDSAEDTYSRRQLLVNLLGKMDGLIARQVVENSLTIRLYFRDDITRMKARLML